MSKVNKINNGGRPRKSDNDKAKPTDRLKCTICGGSFTLLIYYC